MIIAVDTHDAGGRTVSVRCLGSNEQTVLKLDHALAAFAKEAAPPDLSAASPPMEGSA